MKITIIDRVMADSMGDGWNDEAQAAYAEYVEQKYLEHIRSEYPVAEIIVNVNAERACGWSPPISVCIDSDTEDEAGLESSIEDELSYVASSAWESWCAGDGDEYTA